MAQKTGFLKYNASQYAVYLIAMVYTRTKAGVTIHGAELYKENGDFVGFWDSYNIPVNTMAAWRKLIKEHYPLTGLPEDQDGFVGLTYYGQERL